VRASTLNDLFSGVGEQRQRARLRGRHAGRRQRGHALGDPNLDTGHYDDGHSFGWKMKDSNGGAWHDLGMGSGDVHAQLDEINRTIRAEHVREHGQELRRLGRARNDQVDELATFRPGPLARAVAFT